MSATITIANPIICRMQIPNSSHKDMKGSTKAVIVVIVITAIGMRLTHTITTRWSRLRGRVAFGYGKCVFYDNLPLETCSRATDNMGYGDGSWNINEYPDSEWEWFN
ncbi:MAG: hypothetical protein WBX01_04875 [Nitrososphaeraceae archaeon]